VKSRISSKGRVTVPLRIRERLGLAAGTPITFEVRDGAVVIRKGTRGTHPVDRAYGTLRLSRPVDALLDEMRGPRRPKRGSG
jgi:AbrB family looped-hinge helix DNA binding protein